MGRELLPQRLGMLYASMSENQISNHAPTLVYFNESNEIVDTKSSIPTQRLRSL